MEKYPLVSADAQPLAKTLQPVIGQLVVSEFAKAILSIVTPFPVEGSVGS